MCQSIEKINYLTNENCEKSQKIREQLVINENLKKLSQKLGTNELTHREEIRNKVIGQIKKSIILRIELITNYILV